MIRASFLLLALASLISSSCKSVSLGGSEPDAGDQSAGGSTSPSGSSLAAGSGGNGGADAAASAGIALLTVNPPSVDVGAVDVGATSVPVVVTVSNAGTATSGPLTVTVSGDGIAASGCSGMTLAPQASCTIAITAQGTGGPISGTVEVGDTATNTNKIAVTGIVTGPPAPFSLSPSPLDLGSVLMGKSASGTIVVTNITATRVTGIVVNVSGEGFTLSSTGTCTDTLATGQACNIDVRFAAGTTFGPAKGTVTVTQGGVTKTVQVTATVAGAVHWFIEPTSASLQTIIGTPSSPVTFNLSRPDASLTVTITGSNKDDFSFTTTCDQPATNGESTCQVVVVYNPKVRPTTNAFATLTIAEPGPSGASVSAPLTGIATDCGSGGGITGPQNDFGAVVVGSASKELTFTITNSGGAEVDGIAVSTGGAFAIATDNCTGKVLPAKSQCTFTAQFKPVEGDAGVIQGQLKAVLGTGPCSLDLRGVTGTAVPSAKLAVNPKVLEFGGLPVLQESVAQTLTIANAGAAPTGALKVDKTGTAFAIKSDTCTGASLSAAGTTKSCSITLTYTPVSQPSEATGSITVTDTTGAAAVPVTATLHGTGVAPTTLVLSPASVCPQNAADDPLCIPSASTNRFNNMPVGQATPEMAFVLSNTTDPTIAPDSGTISFKFEGEAAADFAIVKNDCAAAPLISATTPTTCTLTVTFNPSAAGLRKAVLKAMTSLGGSAQALLEGKGLS